jgi:hypothetical protein
MVVGLAAALLTVCADRSFAFYEVNLINGVTNQTEELTGFATTGDMMAGMDVTAYFSDGSSEAVVWQSLGFPAGEAQGTGWSLFEIGDTFTNSWRLRNDTGKTLRRMFIDAGAGDTVFDTDFGGAVGTAGSSTGRTFMPTTSHIDLDITANYIDRVALTGDAPIGDLFRYLEIDFNATGFASGREFRYITDTDNIEHAGDIDPIPEPGTFGILLAGLLGIGWSMRRRRA